MGSFPAITASDDCSAVGMATEVAEFVGAAPESRLVAGSSEMFSCGVNTLLKGSTNYSPKRECN